MSPTFNCTYPVSKEHDAVSYVAETLRLSGYDPDTPDDTWLPPFPDPETINQLCRDIQNSDPSPVPSEEERVILALTQLVAFAGTTLYVAAINHGATILSIVVRASLISLCTKRSSGE